jgi:hypothetical protein
MDCISVLFTTLLTVWYERLSTYVAERLSLQSNGHFEQNIAQSKDDLAVATKLDELLGFLFFLAHRSTPYKYHFIIDIHPMSVRIRYGFSGGAAAR